MIYLELFAVFFEIGALTFGGGYAMIPLIREKVLGYGWLCEEDLLSMIAVSESTPGPIAVNMATFVGSSQGGFFGSLAATLGVVLPSFVVILLVSAVIGNFMKYSAPRAFMSGVRPCVVGLILATSVTLALSTLLGYSNDSGVSFCVDYIGIAIFLIAAAVSAVVKKKTNTAPSPIVLILISALAGGVLYSI